MTLGCRPQPAKQAPGSHPHPQISTQLPHGYSSLGDLPLAHSPSPATGSHPRLSSALVTPTSDLLHFHWGPSIPYFLCLESPHPASTTPSPSSLGKILFILKNQSQFFAKHFQSSRLRFVTLSVFPWLFFSSTICFFFLKTKICLSQLLSKTDFLNITHATFMAYSRQSLGLPKWGA